ncbi:hypothetical protein Glove_408g23 [Diversispora epigaea]|uniref:Uncharacterized protein n=1 Tax=Diversispora epigaea TaxID=1348612 RepID=A0A397H2P7_9GLOM|nr:hypothetical protein Glove_408g23 [Diversispora epigaea]
MLRHITQKYTPKYISIRSLVQNANDNGIKSLQFIKDTQDIQLFKLLSANSMITFGSFSLMKKEVKDAVKPLDDKLNKLNDQMNKLDNRIDKLNDWAYTLSVDMACVKTHLGLFELNQNSPTSQVSLFKLKTK